MICRESTKDTKKEGSSKAQAIFTTVVLTTIPVVLVLNPDLLWSFLLWFSPLQFR